jgi:hypothetical protein
MARWSVLGVLGALGLGLSSQAFAAEPLGSQPTPKGIAADVPLVLSDPAPSAFDRGQLGPANLLPSSTVDLAAGTVTLPLHEGRMKSGETVWFVLFDTSDRGQAEALGLNYAPKLTFAEVGKAVRTARLESDYKWVFDAGKVDFKPVRKVTPGAAPRFYPPAIAEPGSVGDADYTPLVKLVNAGGAIYNAPVVAFNASAATLNQFCKGSVDHAIVHDRVTAICPETGKVTLTLAVGFSGGRALVYTSTDANEPAPSALEASTYAPALGAMKVGPDASPFSPLERVYVVINGPTGVDNPMRQGLDSALSDGRSPINVFGSIPTVSNRYSPIWDVNAAIWTEKAIKAGARSRLTEELQVLSLVKAGYISGKEGKAFGSIGFLVNCPVVFRLN